MNILRAMTDLEVFGGAFRDPDTWRAWRAFLCGLFGLSMTGRQRELFNECTGNRAPPIGGSRETWIIAGRRSGKSFVLSLIAVYLACFKDWRPYLTTGERATVMIIASDRKQARVIMGYVRGLLTSVPMLAATVETETSESIALTNRVVIEIHTASFKTTRGYTVVAALLDEIAFWPTDELAADPDTEVINALKPAMATVPGAVLLAASSPYGRKGALWSAYQKHYGKNSRVLVWQAPTRTMNSTVPQALIDDALADDPAAASAEWLAVFRSDVESFVSREAVEACISHGVFERPPATGIGYKAFCDPSGGSSDSFTMAIAHRDADRGVLDVVREYRPPFSPENVVHELASLLKSYSVDRCASDRWGGEFVRELFSRQGIRLVPSDKVKSDLYLDLLPALNSRLVDLLDNPRLLSQLISLERHTTSVGRDRVDHPPRQHDDVANACAGALTLVLNRKRRDELQPVGVPWTFNEKGERVTERGPISNLNWVSTSGCYRSPPLDEYSEAAIKRLGY
jgi:hypothetical protein